MRSVGPTGVTPCNTGDGAGDDNIQFTDVYANMRRHSGASNCLFVDGHVKWLRPEATIIFDFANTQLITADTFGFRFR